MSFLFSRLFPLFCVIVLLLGGWVALHFQAAVEWRDQPVLQLTKRQQQTLQAIKQEVVLEAYISGNPRLVRAVQNTVIPLKKWLPQLTLKIINPDTHPALVQKYNITRNGQLYLHIGDTGQKIETIAPETIVQTLLDLSTYTERQIIHLQGSGERAFLADSGGSWRPLYEQLRQPKVFLAVAELGKIINLPETADLVVVADPNTSKAEHLNAALKTYLAQGGNLLYTTDTQHPFLPKVLQSISGLRLLNGTVVDMASQQLGFEDPRILPAAINEQTELTQSLQQLPILPGAVAMTEENAPEKGWTRTILLQSSPNSWNEQGEISGHIALDVQETRGPLPVAWLLTREYQGRQQSIVIMGDSDIFQQQAFGMAGNRAFAQALFTYLAQIEGGEQLNRPNLKDQYIQLSTTQTYWWAGLQLLGLPLSIFLLGWYLRRRIEKRYQA